MYLGFKDNLDTGVTFDNLKEELDHIKMYIENYDELSDYEKYKLLSFLMYIRYNTKDLLDLLNIEKGTKFTRTIDISTKSVWEQTLSEGHGRDFSWWTEKYRNILVCATYDTYELEDLLYSNSDLESAIRRGLIYPLYTYQLTIKNYSETDEKNKPIECWNGKSLNIKVDENAYRENKLIIRPKKEIIESYMKLFNKNVSKEELYTLIKRYFRFYLEKLDDYYYYENKEIIDEMKAYYDEHFKNQRKLVKIKK